MTEDGFDGDELMMVHFHMVGADDQRSNEHLATTSYSIRTQPFSGLPLTFRVHEMQAVEQSVVWVVRVNNKSCSLLFFRD